MWLLSLHLCCRYDNPSHYHLFYTVSVSSHSNSFSTHSKNDFSQITNLLLSYGPNHMAKPGSCFLLQHDSPRPSSLCSFPPHWPAFLGWLRMHHSLVCSLEHFPPGSNTLHLEFFPFSWPLFPASKTPPRSSHLLLNAPLSKGPSLPFSLPHLHHHTSSLMHILLWQTGLLAGSNYCSCHSSLCDVAPSTSSVKAREDLSCHLWTPSTWHSSWP